MPKGIITRIIVRLNEWIDGENKNDLVWEKGVVLKKAGVRAQVTEQVTRQEGLKVINIELAGQEYRKKEVLTLIREEINKIHRTSFKNINVQEMVPIPQQPDIAVSYEHLLTLQQLREQTFIPEGMKTKVSVQKLLDGVEPPETGEERLKGRPERKQMKFAAKIDFKPTIVTTVNATSSSEASSQINFELHISGLAGGLDELKDEAIAIEPKLQEDFEALQRSVKKIEQAEKPEEVKNSGPMNKIRRFLTEAEDTGSQLGKTIQKAKAGYGIMQDIAENYNKIAQSLSLQNSPKTPSFLSQLSGQNIF